MDHQSPWACSTANVRSHAASLDGKPSNQCWRGLQHEVLHRVAGCDAVCLRPSRPVRLEVDIDAVVRGSAGIRRVVRPPSGNPGCARVPRDSHGAIALEVERGSRRIELVNGVHQIDASLWHTG